MLQTASRKQRIDVPETMSRVLGFFTLGIVDVSVVVALIWAVESFPILKMAVIVAIAIFLGIGLFVGMVFRLGRDEYDSK